MPRVKQIQVMDARIPLMIEVRKQDLQQACPGDMDNCAIAKAIKRQLGVTDVCVGTKIISILKDEFLVRFGTPHKISKCLPIFDKTGCWPLPFGIYTLKPPSKCFTIKARIAHTKEHLPIRGKKTGKSLLYTSGERQMHSRKSSHFKSEVKRSILNYAT
jgi:hypothetical protein